MTELEQAREHLFHCQFHLALKRQTWDGKPDPIERGIIREAERNVIAALSWVWEEQERIKLEEARAAQKVLERRIAAWDALVAVKPLAGKLKLTPVVHALSPDDIITWPDGTAWRIVQ